MLAPLIMHVFKELNNETSGLMKQALELVQGVWEIIEFDEGASHPPISRSIYF